MPCSSISIPSVFHCKCETGVWKLRWDIHMHVPQQSHHLQFHHLLQQFHNLQFNHLLQQFHHLLQQFNHLLQQCHHLLQQLHHHFRRRFQQLKCTVIH